MFERVHGDSRDRGPVMIDLIQTYARAGLYLDPEKLPDHVPVLLEFVSTQPPLQAHEFLAESALLELARKDVPAGRFEQLAAELANELFFQTDSRWGMGVHPRLVHTRFGLHIIEVLGRKKGRLPAYEEVRERIASRLALQSSATALRQYLQLLVGEAAVEGVELEGATSLLLQ